MKKLALIVTFVVLASGAQAATYIDGKNRVVIPEGCVSWSCMSVSIPGHFSHNVKPQQRAQQQQRKG